MICTNIVNKQQTNEMAEKVLQALKDSLALSLGPYGSNAIIEGTSLEHKMTKDGYTILKSIKFNDPIALTFLELFRDASAELVEEVGDASTTTIIAAYYLYIQFKKLMKEENVRPRAIVDTSKIVVKELIHKIQNYKTMITENNIDKLSNVAAIALNNDEVLGRRIGEIYEKVGNEGFISVKVGSNDDTEIVYGQGFKIDNGYIDKVFINSDNSECKLNHSLILMFDSYLNDEKYCNFVIDVLNTINSELREPNHKYDSLVVLAPDFGPNMTKKLMHINSVYDKNGATYNYNFIKYSLADSHYKDIYYDLSAMVSANIIKSSAEEEIEYENGDVSDEIERFGGYSSEVVSNSHSTTFYNSETDRVKVFKIKSDIRSQLGHMKEENIIDDVTTYSLKKRLAILEGNLVTIYVGGDTEQERIATKMLVDDAVAACRSALEYGYVPGCNVSIIQASHELGAIAEQANSYLTKRMCECIEKAFINVYKEVLNKGNLSDTLINELVDKAINEGVVFDLVREQVTKETVINSVRTEEMVLKNVVNIITLILTSNQYITNVPRVGSEI